ncbi:hypothetical protein [Streptococcus anginosus]|uniref:hypothetical protein n=1 Tax=Streptococcus anginosus TaxID=1328 RepID=UPI000C79C2F1|nr:hypothetical protein [Streptococcus anginosus]PLA02630.1 hypothetical protein CYK12_00075 [Streptococcus anginosus]PLA06921.1 hypothetical protein CYK09_03160 [Streptococcus anginosus]PLA58951.1 hypothetical protein CYK15_00075 [Streptococcus anginosus]PLA66660.1 hypothetical protein CYK13_00075 [Streptococcus anginosus]
MVDRSYLPWQCAREYQDVGMQKWMGFFLSEHTTALSDDANKITYLSDLVLENKLLLIIQLYTGQLTAKLVILFDEKRVSYTGTVSEVNKSRILIKTKEGHVNVTLNEILNIELVEKVEHESA